MFDLYKTIRDGWVKGGCCCSVVAKQYTGNCRADNKTIQKSLPKLLSNFKIKIIKIYQQNLQEDDESKAILETTSSIKHTKLFFVLVMILTGLSCGIGVHHFYSENLSLYLYYYYVQYILEC